MGPIHLFLSPSLWLSASKQNLTGENNVDANKDFQDTCEKHFFLDYLFKVPTDNIVD